MLKGTVFYIPVEQAVTPINGDALCGNWWSVHPEKGLAFICKVTADLKLAGTGASLGSTVIELRHNNATVLLFSGETLTTDLQRWLELYSF